MRKILLASACFAAGLALTACGSPEEAAPAATDSATDAATTEAEAAAGPAEAASATEAPATAPAETGAMSPTTPAAGAPPPTLNEQVPGGVVNPSDPVPPPPGQTATYGPRPQN